MIYAGLCVYSLLLIGKINCELFELSQGTLNGELFRDNAVLITLLSERLYLLVYTVDDALKRIQRNYLRGKGAC